MIRDGETGLLFCADDPASLAETVLGALEDPSRAAVIRAAARRYVETQRSWGVSVAGYGPVYERLLGSPRVRGASPLKKAPPFETAGSRGR